MSTFTDQRGTVWTIDLDAVSRSKFVRNICNEAKTKPERLATRLLRPSVCADTIVILTKGNGHPMRLRSDLLDSNDLRRAAMAALLAAIQAQPTLTPGNA